MFFVINKSNIWNLKQLDGPPLVTFDYSLIEYENTFSKTNYHLFFEQHLNKLIDLVETKSDLFTNEKIILEKLIYKNWNPLRKEKSMQLMRQLKRLLNKFEQIKLIDLIRSIKDLTISRQTNNKSLPSKEFNEYFLVRVYSTFKLLEYTIEMIRSQLFIDLMKLIKNAIYLPNNILFVSTVARIYFILKKYKQNITFIYNCLRENIHLFKSTQIEWSNDFKIDQMPIKICCFSNEKNLNNSNNELNLVEFEALKINEEVLQDIGVKIERNEKNDLLFIKWKKVLLTNIQKMIRITFKKAGSTTSLVKFNKKLSKFLNSKLNKFKDDYTLFLNDLLNKKLINKKDFKIKSIKKKLILKAIYKSISKFCINKI